MGKALLGTPGRARLHLLVNAISGKFWCRGVVVLHLLVVQIHFLETMHALAGRIAGTAVPEDEEQKVRRMLYPRLPSKDAADIPKYGVSHFYAALYVQAAVRGFLKRHALKEGRSTYSSMAGASAAGQAQQQQRRRSAQWQWLLAPRGAPAEPAAGSTHQHQQQQEGRTQEATQLHLEPRTDAG